jgi:excisionase family DNA binding protein
MQTVLCPKEVAGELGVSERTARRLMREQSIESFRVGDKLWRTHKARVLEYVAGQYGRYRRPVTGPITELRAA